MKPELAKKTSFACDLTESSVEATMADIDAELRKEIDAIPIAMRFEAKVSQPALVYAHRALQKLRIPIRVVDHYECDEWSIVCRAFYASEPNIVRKEIWSEGA